MAINNHLDETMHSHYATVSATEMTRAVAQVIDLAGYRKAHENADGLLEDLHTSLHTTRV